jgi:hypothetical protein
MARRGAGLQWQPLCYQRRDILLVLVTGTLLETDPISGRTLLLVV